MKEMKMYSKLIGYILLFVAVIALSFWMIPGTHNSLDGIVGVLFAVGYIADILIFKPGIL